MSDDATATLGAGSYISLTTYRADGSPVPTPVWVATDGRHLLVTTSADSWKVRRLRADDRVSVAPCDARGRVKGPAVEGRAELLDPAGSAEVLQRIRDKYGLMGRMIVLMNRLRRRSPEQIGLRITLA